MMMTGVVERVGTFERLAARLEAYARRTSAARSFAIVFAASAVVPALLNNDSAVLLLLPLVIALTRRLYPGKPAVTEAFAFAVFLAPGVAPLVVSNPMNMIVAEYAGIGFLSYARIMLPISVCGALLSYAIVRWRFREALASAVATPRPVEIPPAHPAERKVLLLVAAVFFAYPITAALGGQIWMVTLLGAVLAFALARLYRVAPTATLAGHISIDILVFLWGVFLVVAGLRNAGVVGELAALYRVAPGGSALQLGLVGGTAAVGSALVDNHPMSILNMLAIGAHGQGRSLLAALVGGNIGPRLLPIGSLAGLLWMDILRRARAEVSLGRFARTGTLLVIPTLLVSLLLLAFL
jgi:arsenical pump membrane protein